MAAFNKFNSFPQKLTDKAISFAADTFKVMLSNTLPVATNAVKTDITEISAGNGYSAGGTVTTITESSSGGVVTVKGSAVVFTATGAVGPFEYAVLYDSTTNDLVGWWDYAAAVTMANTETFTVTFDSTNGIFKLS